MPADEMMDEELDVGRRLARRRFAHWSFYSLMLVGTLLIGVGLTSDGMAQRLSTMSGLIGVVFGAWTGVIMIYMGASAYEAKAKPRSRSRSRLRSKALVEDSEDGMD